MTSPTLQGHEGDVSVPLSVITQVLSEHVRKHSQNPNDQQSMATFARTLLGRIKQSNPSVDEKQFITDAGLTNIGQRAA